MEYLIIRNDTDQIFQGYGASQLPTLDIQITTEWDKYVKSSTKTFNSRTQAELVLSQLLRFGFRESALYIVAEQSS